MRQFEQELREAFYWFHRHPELAYEEYQTTGRIKELLAAKGIEVLPLGLATGVVAVIRGEQEGPVAAIRCDIDGLPIAEESGLEYTSEHAGRMHACGHDFHLTAVLGAAFLLQERKSELRGTVKVIFQPAEESGLGALKIIETGVLEDVKVIFGLHVDPQLAVGMLGVSEGSVMAAVDRFCMKITGCGCHAAHPDSGVDPIVISAGVIMALQTVVSRNLEPFAAGVVSVTRIAGGNTWNVIPGEVVLEGTVRMMGKEERKLIRKRVAEVVCKTAESYGGSGIVEWTAGPPATINDGFWAEFAASQARAAGFLVEPVRKSMGGEDFAFYQETIKGCFMKVGTGTGHAIHHPAFQADPGALKGAACLMADLAEGALGAV